MAIVAFITWLVTAVCGLGLLSIYLIEYDGGLPTSRLPKTAIGGHVLFAVAGLSAWTLFLFTSMRRVAWAAVAILVVVAILGFTMLFRWVGTYRTNRAQSPVLMPVGAQGVGAQRVGFQGVGVQGATMQPPAPPERHLPIALITVHGVLAVVTLLLVLLTTLDVAGP
jgi:hypothetical protein